MSNDKRNFLFSELDSSKYLLKRFKHDMVAIHQQMEVLRIVFKNLEGSWLAISLAYKAVKEEIEEDN